MAEYIAAWGAAGREEITELLHIGKRHTARLLREMAEKGKLEYLPEEKLYNLPPHEITK